MVKNTQHSCGLLPQCLTCPLRRGKACCRILDRGLRSAFFAALFLKQIVPSWEKELSSILHYSSRARDITELIACARDLDRLDRLETLTSDRTPGSAIALHRVARVLGLLASIITPLPIIENWGIRRFQHYTPTLDPLARTLTAVSHIANVSSLALETHGPHPKKMINSSMECTYNLLELFIDYTPVPIQSAIGVTTGAWGIYRSL